MHRVAFFPLLGPAVVFYLVADIASSRASDSAFDYMLAVVALGLSFAPRSAGAPAPESRAGRLLGWLGLSSALALLRLLSVTMPHSSLELAEGAALCAVGALLFDLALSLPEPIATKRIRRIARIATYIGAGVCALLAALALAPTWTLFGRTWFLPRPFVGAAATFACLATFGALGLRIFRSRTLVSQPALIANFWGLLALAPASLFGIMLAIGLSRLPGWLVHGTATISALAIYIGHVFLIDPRRRVSLSARTRDVIAIALTVAAMAGIAVAFSDALQSQPFAHALWVAATLLLSLGLYLGVRESLRRLLAPDRGRLLAALAATQPELGRAQTLETLVALSLAGLRAANSGGWTRPLLYGFDPLFEGQIDAAGAPHLAERGPHPMLLAQLRAQPGDLIVRAELELQMVRQPSVRPLVDALVEHDVLCVLPLVVEGELEGALLLPRGQRRSQLTAEEHAALWELARYLAGVLAVFSSKRRAELRANVASLDCQHMQEQMTQLNGVVQSLAADCEVLHAQRSHKSEAATLVAYSAPQRALLASLHEVAAANTPLLFVSEPGVAVEPIARFVHAESVRASAPFVVLDCAAVRADQAEAALLGGIGPLGREVGCLRVAGTGTLLLLDVAALPHSVQHKLALAIVNGRVAPGYVPSGSAHGGSGYSVRARVLASAAHDVTERGRLAQDLADQLLPSVQRIPALRECGDDIDSLVLLAIDRASRRYGRGAMGIEPEALAALRAYAFPGNHSELAFVVESAVARAGAVRLTLADFASSGGLAAKSGEDMLLGTLEEIERRALVHALMRSGGNKSEAARLLGMPRTSLLDKLRRHKLEDVAPDNTRAN